MHELEARAIWITEIEGVIDDVTFDNICKRFRAEVVELKDFHVIWHILQVLGASQFDILGKPKPKADAPKRGYFVQEIQTWEVNGATNLKDAIREIQEFGDNPSEGVEVINVDVYDHIDNPSETTPPFTLHEGPLAGPFIYARIKS